MLSEKQVAVDPRQLGSACSVLSQQKSSDSISLCMLGKEGQCGKRIRYISEHLSMMI